MLLVGPAKQEKQKSWGKYPPNRQKNNMMFFPSSDAFITHRVASVRTMANSSPWGDKPVVVG